MCPAYRRAHSRQRGPMARRPSDGQGNQDRISGHRRIVRGLRDRGHSASDAAGREVAAADTVEKPSAVGKSEASADDAKLTGRRGHGQQADGAAGDESAASARRATDDMTSQWITAGDPAKKGSIGEAGVASDCRQRRCPARPNHRRRRALPRRAIRDRSRRRGTVPIFAPRTRSVGGRKWDCPLRLTQKPGRSRRRAGPTPRP